MCAGNAARGLVALLHDALEATASQDAVAWGAAALARHAFWFLIWA